MPAVLRVICFLALFSIAACASPDGAPDPGPSVPIGRWADTSSVEIVRNDKPLWTERDAWHLTPEATLQIGVVEGDAAYQLAQAHSPVRLSDGTIAVANMATNQIRFFNSRGRYIRDVGGAGQGPGEFEQLYRMKKINGDSLMALNPATLTSIFTPDGRYIRRFTLDLVNGRPNMWWLGRLDSGVLLAHSLMEKGTQFEGRSPESDGHEGRIIRPERPEGYRDSLMLFLYTMDGKMIDSLGDLPSQYLGDNEAFAPNGGYAFHKNRFFHGPGDVFEIRVFELRRGADPPLGAPPEGFRVRLEKVITRAPVRDLTVTAELQKAYIDAEWEQLRKFNLPPGARPNLPDKFPARFPAHGRLLADAEGNLWVQEYALLAETATRWTVLDPNGRWLGMVDMPEYFNVNEIGPDYALGIWRDDAGVQYVRMYGLVKPGGR